MAEIKSGDSAVSFIEALEEVYGNHAADIGRVAISWNSFLTRLSYIFVSLISPESNTLLFAAWHSLRADRAQREMLKAVIEAKLEDASQLREPFRWAFGKADSLENDRNNLIHSPYTISILAGKGDLAMTPDTWSGHQRAKNLVGKDLARECKLAAHRVDGLSIYFDALHVLMHEDDENLELPEKPNWQLSE